jgi:hypothetical protein
MADTNDVVPVEVRPSLGKWFLDSADKVKGKLRVAMPARIESYDASTQTASVKPLLQALQRNADGSTTSVSRPVVNAVPVLMPQGGGFQVKLPVAKGDIVLLVFCDRSLDIWKSKGGEVDPIDFRQHHISDAVAVPCFRDPTSAPAAKIEIQADGTVLLGGSGASHPLIFGDDFSSPSGAFNTLLQAIATAVGTSGSPAGATAAAASIVAAITVYQAAVTAKLSTAVKTA